MDALARLARAVLYEGYVLWPYRRSALKNRHRWTFGVVQPPAYAASEASMQAECLLEHDGGATLDVRLRFLHVVARQVMDAAGIAVDMLEVDGEQYLSWDEAREREVAACGVRLDTPRTVAVAVSAGVEEEPCPAGTIVRTWDALSGTLAVACEPLRRGLSRVAVTVSNTSPYEGGGRDAAVRRALCSAHLVLHAERGRFVSATDPPAELRAEVSACRNTRTWPVLVGEEGERHTMLAAPVILPDYPEVAPESPGDLFDATEIDQLLVLNVLGLTEAEQAEMRATDARTRDILDRCRALTSGDLLRLHGAVRGLRSLRRR